MRNKKKTSNQHEPGNIAKLDLHSDPSSNSLFFCLIHHTKFRTFLPSISRTYLCSPVYVLSPRLKPATYALQLAAALLPQHKHKSSRAAAPAQCTDSLAGLHRMEISAFNGFQIRLDQRALANSRPAAAAAAPLWEVSEPRSERSVFLGRTRYCASE